MKFNKKSILCFAAMLAVMMLIFNFSSEDGIASTGTSTGVTVSSAFTGYWGARYYGACRVL